MAINRCLTDEEFAEQILDTPAAGDRVRLTGLDHTGVLADAKERSLRRELAIKSTRYGEDSPQASALAERVRLQQVLRAQIRAELQRGEIETPARRADAFILHGRVVDQRRIGQPSLTVSVLERRGEPKSFVCTDERGYFRLEIPIENSGATRDMFLQVSDRNQAVLIHDDEAHRAVPERIVYRELVLGEEKPEAPCPPPPEPSADAETVQVPNVVGKLEVNAADILKATNLAVGQRKQKTAPEDKIGYVLAQKPKAGANVPAGSEIDLVIGAQSKVRVPQVVGLKLAPARKELKKGRLKVGTIKERQSAQVGVVLEQSAEADREVPAGTVVDLIVGRHGITDG